MLCSPADNHHMRIFILTKMYAVFIHISFHWIPLMHLQTSAWIPDDFPLWPSHGNYLVHSVYSILVFTFQPVLPLCPDLLSLPLLFQFLKSLLVGHITGRLLKATLHLPKLSWPYDYCGLNKTKEDPGCNSPNTMPVLFLSPWHHHQRLSTAPRRTGVCGMVLRGVLSHSWWVRWVFKEAVFRSRPLTWLFTTCSSLNYRNTDLIDDELVVWLHPKGCGQCLNAQMEISE